MTERRTTRKRAESTVSTEAKRVQVYLSTPELEALKAEATPLKRSQADILREALRLRTKMQNLAAEDYYLTRAAKGDEPAVNVPLRYVL